MDPIHLREMGITEPIATAEQITSTLGLLSAPFSFIGKPLVLIVDQCEKLLPDDNPSARTAISGQIRSWIELFVNRNGMLICAGTPQAWERLPEDVQQRFAARVIDLPLLRLDEATDIIRIYVTPEDAPYSPATGSIAPFSSSAILTMLSLTGGNPRKFLQLAYLAFELFRQHEISIITDETVRTVASADDSGQFLSIDGVHNELARLMSRYDGQVVSNYNFSGLLFDIAFLNNNKPVLLVQIKEAIVAQEEALNAIHVADTVTRLHAKASDVRYVLVVFGYVSPQVLQPLQDVVKNLIVYSRSSFPK